MKKPLSWKFLIPFGIALALIRAVTTGLIPDSLGLLQAIVLAMGIIDFLRWLFKGKSPFQKQKGFVQIPVLFALVLSAVVFGIGGYLLAYRPNEHASAQPEPKTLSSSTTTASGNVTAGSVVQTDQNTHKVNPPAEYRIISSPSPAPRYSPKIITDPSVSSQSNPNEPENTVPTTSPPSLPAQQFPCGSYYASISSIQKLFSSLADTLNDNDVEENPSKTDFDYPYNTMLAQKNSFGTRVDAFQKQLSDFDSYEGAADGKVTLINSVSALQQDFDLKLQAFGLMTSSQYVNMDGFKIMPRGNLTQGKALLDQSNTQFSNATNLLSKGIDELLAVSMAAGCK